MSIYSSRMREWLLQSGLVWVAAGFAILIALNLITLALGSSRLLADLENNPWGPFVSVFVFDSWGTAGGLAGVVVLFIPLLFGVPSAQRRRLSLFFLTASILIGVAANVLWTDLLRRHLFHRLRLLLHRVCRAGNHLRPVDIRAAPSGQRALPAVRPRHDGTSQVLHRRLRHADP